MGALNKESVRDPRFRPFMFFSPPPHRGHGHDQRIRNDCCLELRPCVAARANVYLTSTLPRYAATIAPSIVFIAESVRLASAESPKVSVSHR